MTKQLTEKGKLVSVQPEVLLYADKTDLDSLKYDELVELGRGVSEVKIYSQWMLGKLGDKVMKKYGDLTKYAKDINQNYEVLQQWMNTYRKFTTEDPNFSPDKYHGMIPWAVLQLVATKSDTPVTLLNELTDKGINSFEHVYREIKTKQTGKEVPKKPRINLKFNDELGKWKIRILPEDLDLIDWTDVREQLINYLNSLV